MKNQYTNKLTIAALAALLATAGCATTRPSIDSKVKSPQGIHFGSIPTGSGQIGIYAGDNFDLKFKYNPGENYQK